MKTRETYGIVLVLFTVAALGGCAPDGESAVSEEVTERSPPALEEVLTPEQVEQVQSALAEMDEDEGGEHLGTSHQALNGCKMACAGVYGAACVSVTTVCATGSVVTLGGVSVPCVAAIAAACGALAVGAEGCSQTCDNK